jgi:hypothetical protein
LVIVCIVLFVTWAFLRYVHVPVWDVVGNTYSANTPDMITGISSAITVTIK